MKDGNGNKVGIGTPLYANLGEYGPCCQIVGADPQYKDTVLLSFGTFVNGEFFQNRPTLEYEYHDVYNYRRGEYEIELRLVEKGPFRMTLESLNRSYWSATPKRNDENGGTNQSEAAG